MRLNMMQASQDKWVIEARRSPDEKNPLLATVELHPYHPMAVVTVDNIGELVFFFTSISSFFF